MIPTEVKVRDCMTCPAITIPAAASLRDAEKLMKEYNIRHLPVLKGDKLAGILSSGDLRRARPSDAVSLSIWEINYLWDQLKVEAAMTRQVVTVRDDVPVVDAIRLMLEHRFSSLPVVNADGKPAGMLTEVDIFRLVIQVSEGQPSLHTVL
jgi:acetoin utilization protein AcuB